MYEFFDLSAIPGTPSMGAFLAWALITLALVLWTHHA